MEDTYDWTKKCSKCGTEDDLLKVKAEYEIIPKPANADNKVTITFTICKSCRQGEEICQ